MLLTKHALPHCYGGLTWNAQQHSPQLSGVGPTSRHCQHEPEVKHSVCLAINVQDGLGPADWPQAGYAAPLGTDRSDAHWGVSLGPENMTVMHFSVFRKDPCFCLASSHLHVFKYTCVVGVEGGQGGQQEKEDCFCLKGAAYIQMHPPLSSKPKHSV